MPRCQHGVIKEALASLTPDYLSDFDAYVYVLTVERTVGGEVFYYVGSTMDFHYRYDNHFRASGSFAALVPSGYGERMVPAAENVYEIADVADFDVVHQRHHESDDEFEARLREQEWRTFAEIACEKDKTTFSVGGESVAIRRVRPASSE